MKNILDQIISSYSINNTRTHNLEIKADKEIYIVEVKSENGKIEKIKIIKNYI